MDIDKIKILVENNVIDIVGRTKPLTIDFVDNSYGKGFIIDTGAVC